MKNEDLVHDIVPESVNNTQRDDLQKESDSRLNVVALDDFLSEEELYADSEGLSIDLYDAMVDALTNLSSGLVSLNEVTKQNKGYLSLDNTKRNRCSNISA